MPPTLDSDQPVATDGRGNNGAIGKLGVVQQGALADLLRVDGDPITSIALVDDPARNFLVIVKDGKTFKNLLR